MCIHGPGGERLPAASYGHHPTRKKKKKCHRRGIDNSRRLFSAHQRPNAFLSDAWPAPATCHGSSYEHCDPRVGGALYEYARFRYDDAIVVFVDRCLSRTRSLAASNQTYAFFSQTDLAPPPAQDFFFCFFFSSMDFIFVKIRAHGERRRSITVGIFGIHTFYSNFAFPLASALYHRILGIRILRL